MADQTAAAAERAAILDKINAANLGLTDLEVETLCRLIFGLYAERGFSDVRVKDLADDITDRPRRRGVIGSLVKRGLVMVEDCDVNGMDRQFLHLAVEWEHLNPRWSR